MGELSSLLRNKTFRRFIISFITVFILPLTVLVFVFNSLTTRMREDVNNREYLIGEQLKSSIDSQLFSLTEVAKKMSGQKNVMAYAQDAEIIDGYLTDRRFSTLRELSDEIAGLRTGYTSLIGAFLYTDEDDRVFSSMGITNSESYYRVTYRDMDYYADWKARLDRKMDSHFFSVGRPAYLSGDSHISYTSVIRYSYDRPVTLVLNMNTALLRSQANSIVEQGSHVAIMHVVTREMVYADSPVFAELYKNGMLESLVQDIQHISTSEGQMILSRHRSYQTGCVYYIMTPESIFYLQVNRTRSLFLVAFGVMLAVGAYLIYLLSRRVYRPIGDLRGGLTGYAEQESGDDFDYIKSAIKQINSDRSTMEQQLYNQSNRMRDLLVSRLLQGRYQSEAAMNQELRDVEVTFDGDYFAVALIWSDSYFIADDEEVYLQQYIVSNVFSEILGERFVTYAVMLDDKTGFLLNFQNDLRREELQRELEAQIDRAMKAYTLHFDTVLYVSVSNVHESMYGIRHAYTEAENLMETVGKDNAVAYAKSEANFEEWALPASIAETHHKLENLLLLGDGIAAAELIRGEIALGSRVLPVWKKNLRRMDLGLCMLRLLTPSNFEQQLLLELDKEASLIMGKETVTTDELCELAAKIAACAKYKDPKTKEGSIEMRAERYVAGHFTDPTLSASSIAEHLGLHVNYLSPLYRKRTGESLLHLISLYRINYAKEMLGATGEKIEDIAIASGFYNSPSFIRTFKRYEGITPGQYRMMQQVKEESL